MIFKICIVLTFLTAAANISSASALSSAHEIERVNENMFIGKKRLPFKKVDGSISTQGDDVYFVLEKLTPYNANFWKEYNAEQDNKTSRMGAVADRNDGSGNKKFVTVVDGIGSFKLSLGLIGKLNSDIWIAYATRKNPRPYPEPEYRDDIPWDKSKWPEDKREEFSEYEKREKLFRDSRMQDRDIEMTFSVLLNATSPITTHMGISRNYEYFLNKKRPHIGLAMELHAFSAKASQHIYGDKAYMVTNPAHEMRNIMLKIFEKHKLTNYIWVGDTKNREQQKDGIKSGIEALDSLYPKELSYVPPFDDRSPSDWTITLRDGSIKKFHRPDWFGVVEVDERGRRNGGHTHLLNHLPTTIIDLEALSSLWDLPAVY